MLRVTWTRALWGGADISTAARFPLDEWGEACWEHGALTTGHTQYLLLHLPGASGEYYPGSFSKHVREGCFSPKSVEVGSYLFLSPPFVGPLFGNFCW